MIVRMVCCTVMALLVAVSPVVAQDAAATAELTPGENLSVVAQEAATTAELTPEENLAKANEYILERGDFFSAMPYLRVAADAGYVRAQVWLAQFLDYGEENAEAEKYFDKAVAQGDPEAKLGLAIMHIAKDTAKPDIDMARHLIHEAAEADYSPAVVALAAAYINGGLGIDDAARQSPAALSWINKAAEKDDITALRKLEEINRLGGLGIEPNAARAAELKAKINQLTGVVEKDETGRRRRK